MNNYRICIINTPSYENILLLTELFMHVIVLYYCVLLEILLIKLKMKKMFLIKDKENLIIFPDDLWRIIIDFLIEYKKHHIIKMKPILENDINNKFIEVYSRWTLFPPWPNTNDIIRDEYITDPPNSPWVPRSNLELVSITKWPNSNINSTGWWCGYGWKKKN